jgi:hypothetical protein
VAQHQSSWPSFAPFLSNCHPTAKLSVKVPSDLLVSTEMKNPPYSLCCWCGTESKSRHSRTEPHLCTACHAQLAGAPTETLIRIIAELAAYNQVALRLLAEGHQVIAHVTSGIGGEHTMQRKKARADHAESGGSDRSVA